MTLSLIQSLSQWLDNDYAQFSHSMTGTCCQAGHSRKSMLYAHRRTKQSEACTYQG